MCYELNQLCHFVMPVMLLLYINRWYVVTFVMKSYLGHNVQL